MRMSIDYVMSGEWLPKDYRSGLEPACKLCRSSYKRSSTI